MSIINYYHDKLLSREKIIMYAIIFKTIREKPLMAYNVEEYIKLTKFISAVLGDNYEIVLHWLDSNDNSYYIADIENSYISGRTINSPITGFALKLVNNKNYLKQDFVTNYKATTDNSTEVQGSTFFIKNKNNELLGLLCINFSPKKYIKIAEEVLSLANINKLSNLISKTDHPENIDSGNSNKTSQEYLHQNIAEVVYSTINPELLDSDVSLTPDKKIEIVSKLKANGIFQIKGAISYVSELLQVSEPSIYRYLKTIEKNEKNKH